MSALLDRLRLETPIVQAGMGGGLSTAPLAGAVSAAGGLGTVGILPAGALRAELTAARATAGPGRPVAVNLLLPFARRAQFEAAADADVVVTFWGTPARRVPGFWMHQCGSVEEARAAVAAGADAVIAQGVEAGGHVRGTVPAAELLDAVRDAVPDEVPVLSAGGIASRDDVAARLAAGADAVVCGTRFVLTEESGAHPAYRERLLAAHETVLTELFGVGWPAPHRVVPNAATRRWLRGDQRGPSWLRAAHRATAPVLSRTPLSLQLRVAATQRAGLPMFGPAAATGPGTEGLVDAGPLYAGECVTRIDDVRPAGDVVRSLAG